MKKYPIELIVAATPTGEIGFNNTLPWKLQGDLQRFKKLTKGGIVIMGRNTFNSLPSGLPGRSVIVVSETLATRNASSHYKQDIITRAISPHYVGSLIEAISDAVLFGKEVGEPPKKIWIAGGAGIYEEMLNIAELEPCVDLTVYLTTVYKDPHTPGYDTVISNFELLGNYDVIDEPEMVFDETYEAQPQPVIDPGLWFVSDPVPPKLVKSKLSHTYSTLKKK